MEEITLEVVGREKDDGAGLPEIKAKLVTAFNLRKSEVSKLVAQRDKVELHKEKGEPGSGRMCALSAELYGNTPILKLSKLPEDGKGGTIGDLIRLHAESTQSCGLKPWRPWRPFFALPLTCRCICGA